MKSLNKIIKKVLSEQNEKKPIITTNQNQSVQVFKNPNGLGFLLPKSMLYGSPELYDKKEWIEWYSDFKNTRTQFEIVLKNNDSTYKKMCYDEQYSEVVKQFLEVRDKWIPDDIEKNTLNIDQDYVDEAIYILNYYKNTKIKPTLSIPNHELLDEVSGYTPSVKQYLDGTDYFFSVMQLFIDANKINLTFQKGNFSNHSSIEKLQKKTLKIGDLEVSLWSWGIQKFEFCDTRGQFISYYTSKGLFVSSLYDKSVFSFSLIKDKYIEWVKNFKYVDEKEISKLESLSNPVKFHACYENKNGAQTFKAYYTDYVKVNDQNLQKGKVWNCFGHKFPENGEILGMSKISSVVSEPGFLSKGKFEQGGLLDIPLTYLDVNNLGQFYKQFVEKRGISALEEQATGTLATFFNVVNSGLGKLSGAYAVKELLDMDNYMNKAEKTIATPLETYSNGMFKEEDFIAHTKISEDTVIYTIPQGGLSQYIPTAKKDRAGRWYITFTAAGNKINLHLPSENWWDEFYDMVYKIKNTVTTMTFNEEYPVFGLVLTISSESNLATIMETKGEEGWTFKLSQTGSMFFGVRESMVNYNNDGYFQVQNQLSPYNFLDTEQLDTRSNFGSFMESWWGIGIQVVVGILLAVEMAPFMALRLGLVIESAALASDSAALITFRNIVMAQGIFRTTILEVTLSIFLEIGVLGVPLATYYQSRGDEMGVILSLVLCFLPLALETKAWGNFTKSLWSKTLPTTRLQKEILGMGAGYFTANMTAEKLLFFVKKLGSRDAMLFGELINNLDELVKRGGINQLLEDAYPQIKRLAEENAEALNKAMPRFRKMIEIGGVNLLATGGSVFVGVTGAQILITYLNSKGRVLSEEQKEQLKKGFEQVAKYFQNRFKKIEKLIQQQIESSNQEIKKYVKDPTEWSIEFLKANPDMLDQMLEKGGWEKVVPTLSTEYDNGLKHIMDNAPLEIFTMWTSAWQEVASIIKYGVKRETVKSETTIPDIEVSGDTGWYKYSKNKTYKKNSQTETYVEVTDEEEKKEIFSNYFEQKIKEITDYKTFETEIKNVQNYFSCLTEDKFKFIEGNKEPDFYLTFKAISGEYVGKQIDVIYNFDTEEDNDYTLLTTDYLGYVNLLPKEVADHYGCKVK